MRVPLREDSRTWDAIVIGAGAGGLTAATQLARKGGRVLCLEKYIIPGGSAGHFEREGFDGAKYDVQRAAGEYERKGYRFDVGSSMMFGLGTEGTTPLITLALAGAGKRIDTVPDPTQIHYHLPKGLDVKVHRKYEAFLAELGDRFPEEREGIRKFYGECWAVFNALNSLELKSLEEPRYLMGQFFKHPVACLTLASYLTTNTGEVARKYIKDEDLLRFIDMECFCWSTVSADLTPMINAGMVFCDRHYGGINYPVGGVGRIPEMLAEGLEEMGGRIEYKANVKRILVDGDGRATGVELLDGTQLRSKVVISNLTRWDTFGRMLGGTQATGAGFATGDEATFADRYKKSPSFVSIHLGVKASALPPDCQCHHIVLKDWSRLEDTTGEGTLFVSIPTVLDPSLAPEGVHIVHCFTPAWVKDFLGEDGKPLPRAEYEALKDRWADRFLERLAAEALPGLTADAVVYREVGSPRTHAKFLGREDGTYGPIPKRRLSGMLPFPMNTTQVPGLYCVGDSTFPGQGVNAVAFSGFGCAHRVAVDLGLEPAAPEWADKGFQAFLNFGRQSIAKALSSSAPN